MRRLARIIWGAAALALGACSSSGSQGGAAGTGAAGGGAAGTGGQQDGGPPATKTYHFQETLNRDVDMVVMIDNSTSMMKLQAKLEAAFPTLIDVLQGLPGGLPNLHLGVVSSSLGAGRAQDIPSCRPGGDQGIFQSMPRGTTCATGSLNAGENFIIASNTGTANFTGSLADTFSCIAALGDTGCGFEHQFASVLRALGADGNGGPPPANANFLRKDAHLFVLFLTNEDDCSAPVDSPLFDTSSMIVSDPLGPLVSYRCNEFGHLCGGARPPRTPPMDGKMDLGMCTSAEDGMLLKVSDVAARLKALKDDPSKVHVAAIAGPPTPYAIEGTVPQVKDETAPQWATVSHSCAAPDMTYADPAVRIAALVDAFGGAAGGNGLFQAICSDSFQPALAQFGQQVARAIASAVCLGAFDVARCTATDDVANAQGVVTHTPLPRCDANGDEAPCWTTRPGNATACDAGFIVTFKRTAPSAAGQSTTITCPL